MNTSPVKHVHRARKRHFCDWCNREISPGESYDTWFCYNETITVRMHPECREAMHKADLYDDELPPAGTYRRGCWCGESAEHCRCAKRTKQVQVWI